ncbi:MAG: thioredoxin [Euryarchaeota archaeon]|nr:thioredoxin [Euryarchaeota archaeon]
MKKLLDKTAKNKTQIPQVPINITDADFDAALKKHPLLLVDFWAAWCNPCRVIALIIEAIAKEYAGKLVCAKLNVDENPITAAKFQVASIPTLLFFKNGKLADRIVGAVPRQHIEARIKQLI